MKFLFSTLLVSLLCTAGSVQAQQQQNLQDHNTESNSKSSVDSLIIQWPAFTVPDSSSRDAANISGMPVYNPGNVDAKMKVWWPATGDHYHMPNASSGKLNLNGPDLGKEEKDNK